MTRMLPIPEVAVEVAVDTTVELSPEQFVLAMRVADLTQFLTRAAAIYVALLGALSYLRQFNNTFPSVNPLPVFGKLARQMSTRERVVLLNGAKIDDVEDFVQTAVTKGESCIVLGGEDISGIYDAWIVGKLRLPIARRTLTGDEDHTFFCDSDYIFESAWFGAAMFQIRDPSQSRALINDIATALRLRSYPQAQAGQTLNLIWAHDAPPDAAILHDIALLVAKTNCRLVLALPTPIDRDELNISVCQEYAFAEA